MADDVFNTSVFALFVAGAFAAGAAMLQAEMAVGARDAAAASASAPAPSTATAAAQPEVIQLPTVTVNGYRRMEPQQAAKAQPAAPATPSSAS